MIAATPSSTDCRREPQNARATTLPTDNIINGNGLIQLLGPESATISGARTLDETQQRGAATFLAGVHRDAAEGLAELFPGIGPAQDPQAARTAGPALHACSSGIV